MIYFFATILFIFILALLIRVSSYIGFIDMPSNRKIHHYNTPLVGGLSIYITLFSLSFVVSNENLDFIILYSSCLIVLLGIIDDRFQISPYLRLIFQIIIISFVIGNGIHIYDLGKYSYFTDFDLGMYKIFLTFFSVLCLINAFNFIDGLDGLASGLAITSLLTFLLFSYYFNDQNFNIYVNDLVYIFIFLLILFFITNITNFKIFKSFLGDAGSTLIGFFISWVLIFYTMPEIRFFHPCLAVWCITLPIFEFLAVIIRRLILKKNPFSPDHLHIHFLMLDLGISRLNTLFILLFISLIFNLLGLTIYLFLGPAFNILLYVILFIIYYYITSLFVNKKNIS